MGESFTIRGGYIIAEVELDSNGTVGTGRADLPLLFVSLRFNFYAHPELHCGLDFRELRCRVSPFEQTYLAHSLPTHLDVRLKSGASLSNHYAQLEIPLDRVRLALLNRLRKGGEVDLRLDLELFVDEVVDLTRVPDPMKSPVWGLLARHRTLSKIRVHIPRSIWLEQVLRGTEFGKVHIIELPAIPIEGCAEMKSAFEALAQAQKLEREGHYNDVVSNCRKALEPFCESITVPDDKGGEKRVQKLKASWQTRLSQHTYTWLDSSLMAVRQAGNEAAHLTSTNYDQMEAQILLMVTTALLAYAVKMRPEAGNSSPATS